VSDIKLDTCGGHQNEAERFAIGRDPGVSGVRPSSEVFVVDRRDEIKSSQFWKACNVLDHERDVARPKSRPSGCHARRSGEVHSD